MKIAIAQTEICFEEPEKNLRTAESWIEQAAQEGADAIFFPEMSFTGFSMHVEELRKRLVGRGTDTPEVIESRIAKAEYELSFAPKFDAVIVNDDLETAKAAALKVITQFLNQ